jgi:hypothetical protein
MGSFEATLSFAPGKMPVWTCAEFVLFSIARGGEAPPGADHANEAVRVEQAAGF